MAVITGYQFEGSAQLAEFDTHGDTRSWTPNVGDAAAVIRHLYQDSGGVVRIEHEGGVKVTAVHKTVIRTSDGRALERRHEDPPLRRCTARHPVPHPHVLTDTHRAAR